MPNSRRRGDATLLVSFCNVKKDKPVLAAIDLLGKGPKIWWLDVKNGMHLSGATGLCYWNDLICVAHQGGAKTSPGFVVLDPDSDFEQVSEGELPSPLIRSARETTHSIS